jgi:hypothetical protein
MNKVVFSSGLSCLMVFLLVLSGCAARVVARPKEATPLPNLNSQVAEAFLVSADYRGSPSLAESKYQGKRLFFKEVQVDTVVRSSGNFYFGSGNLRFKPTYLTDLDYLAEGTVVSVAGNCQGFLWNYVYFTDCWVSAVSGAITTPRTGY